MTREKGRICNALIREMADGVRVRFVDPASVLLLESGRADGGKMRGDFIHLEGAGYDALAGLLQPEIEALLR